MGGKRYTDYKEKILDNVEMIPEAGCWIWMNCLNAWGYGNTGNPGDNGTILVHRLAYQLFIGPIPEGLDVCHHCDIRCCCNPYHLFIGTKQDNMDDMVNKDRQHKGEQIFNRKLTEQEVMEIRAKYATGNYIQKQLADEYNVSGKQISKIVNRLHWKHV